MRRRRQHDKCWQQRRLPLEEGGGWRRIVFVRTEPWIFARRPLPKASASSFFLAWSPASVAIAATANSFKWCYCSLFLLFHHHSCSFFYPRIHLKERSKFTVSQKDPHDTQRFQKILMLKDRTVSKIATSQRSKYKNSTYCTTTVL